MKVEYNLPHSVYFWIAHYDDGTCLPQYDPNVFKENKFSDINQKKLVKFGFYPFNLAFASQLIRRGIQVIPRLLPFFEILLNPEQRLIATRRQHLEVRRFYVCQCKYEWQYDKNMPMEPQVHIDVITHDGKPIRYKSPICPKCDKYRIYVHSCGTVLSKNQDGEIFCHKCGDKVYTKENPIPTKVVEDTNLRFIYILGFQESVGPRTVKSIMFIDENGHTVLGDDFDKVFGGATKLALKHT